MMVGRVAKRFADRRYLLERVQEQQWFEERIVRLADGRLPEQVEQTAAIEDRLLGRDLLYLNRRKILGVVSDFEIDSISQRNGRAHFCVLAILLGCRALTTVTSTAHAIPLAGIVLAQTPDKTAGHKKAAFSFGRGYRS
jgi:hypothetical protein